MVKRVKPLTTSLSRQGRLTVARCFSAGKHRKLYRVPAGRLSLGGHKFQASRRDADSFVPCSLFQPVPAGTKSRSSSPFVYLSCNISE
jgi:hypothetical protein